MDDYNTLITAITLILCLLIFWRSIRIRRHGAKQNDALQALEKEFMAAKEKESRQQEFQNSLKQAEVSTDLQKSRTGYGQKGDKRQAPERYGYARSMFQSGMQSDKIATALDMSCHEINQLQKLADLSSHGDVISG